MPGMTKVLGVLRVAQALICDACSKPINPATGECGCSD
jgi:hypothetical protein